MEFESPQPPRRQGPTAAQRVYVGLLICSGLQLFTAAGVFLYTLGDDDPTARNLVIAQAFGLGMALAVLAMLGRRRPLAAVVTAIALFFAAQLMLAALVPGTLMHGFIVKLVMLLVLMRVLLNTLEERSR